MARGIKVPVGAKLVDVKCGVVRETGEPGRVELFEGMYSDGYKTNYARTPHRWLTVQTTGRTYTFRYSGRAYENGREQFRSCAAEIV